MKNLINDFKNQILKHPVNLSRLLGFKNNWHQTEWYNTLSDKKNQKIAILAPREHSKSTCHSVVYPLWEVLKNKSIRIIVVSSTASQAEAFLRQTTSIIERNKKLRMWFGDLKPRQPEKWTAREIIVDRADSDSDKIEEKDPTISSVGAGGAILSKRADIIVVDDALNKENTRTPEQRKKFKEWFNDVLLPVLVSDGKLIWVSTAFHIKDFSQELLENPLYDFKKTYKAIINEADNQDLWDNYKHLLLNNGKKKANEFYKENKKPMLLGSKVLWPQLRDYKNLYDKRIEVGTRSFNLMYQNDPRNDEDALFKEEWIDNCSDDGLRLHSSFTQSQDIYSIKVRTQGVDLAIKEDPGADETVIFTMGKTSYNKFFLMNVTFGHWSPSTQRKNIAQAGNDFSPNLILVESNAYQASLSKDMQEMTSLPIRGFQTTAEKYDEALGINGLAVGIENGQWILPSDPSDPRTKQIFDKLKEAMLDYRPSEHTPDILIAMWLAWTAMRDVGYVEEQSRVIDIGGMYEPLDKGM